jgi:hypothetical protein
LEEALEIIAKLDGIPVQDQYQDDDDPDDPPPPGPTARPSLGAGATARPSSAGRAQESRPPQEGCHGSPSSESRAQPPGAQKTSTPVPPTVSSRSVSSPGDGAPSSAANPAQNLPADTG